MLNSRKLITLWKPLSSWLWKGYKTVLDGQWLKQESQVIDRVTSHWPSLTVKSALTVASASSHEVSGVSLPYMVAIDHPIWPHPCSLLSVVFNDRPPCRIHAQNAWMECNIFTTQSNSLQAILIMLAHHASHWHQKPRLVERLFLRPPRPKSQTDWRIHRNRSISKSQGILHQVLREPYTCCWSWRPNCC